MILLHESLSLDCGKWKETHPRLIFGREMPGKRENYTAQAENFTSRLDRFREITTAKQKVVLSEAKERTTENWDKISLWIFVLKTFLLPVLTHKKFMVFWMDRFQRTPYRSWIRTNLRCIACSRSRQGRSSFRRSHRFAPPLWWSMQLLRGYRWELCFVYICEEQSKGCLLDLG